MYLVETPAHLARLPEHNSLITNLGQGTQMRIDQGNDVLVLVHQTVVKCFGFP